MKLTLCEMRMDSYDDNKIWAFVYYGTKKTPTDHKGKEIKSVLHNPNDFNDFVNHLEKEICPVLKTQLCKDGYHLIHVDAPTDAPQPFVKIERHDKKSILVSEIQKIEKSLNKAIDLINEQLKVHNPSYKNPAIMFSPFVGKSKEAPLQHVTKQFHPHKKH